MSDTTALALRRSDDELTALAERLAKSTLLPKPMQGKMPDVLVTIMAGQEMGLAPMASLRAFHVIDGKPVMSSDGMVALVLGSGKAQYFDCVSESDTSVTYETLRVGSKVPQRCTWTWDMAKRAALHQKDNWRCYPRQMLASRAKAELARRVYPDVLMGCYSDDEATGWREPSTRQPEAIDAEYVDVQPVLDPDEFAAIDSATSVEALKALGLAVSKTSITDEQKRDVSARYTRRMQWLKSQPVPTSPPSSGDFASVSGGAISSGSGMPSDASTGADAEPAA